MCWLGSMCGVGVTMYYLHCWCSATACHPCCTGSDGPSSSNYPRPLSGCLTLICIYSIYDTFVGRQSESHRGQPSESLHRVIPHQTTSHDIASHQSIHVTSKCHFKNRTTPHHIPENRITSATSAWVASVRKLKQKYAKVPVFFGL